MNLMEAIAVRVPLQLHANKKQRLGLRCARPFRNARGPWAEQRRNRIRVDGFREVMVEAGRGAALVVLSTSPAGHCNKHNFRSSIQRPKTRAELVTVHSWHSQVHERHVGG